MKTGRALLFTSAIAAVLALGLVAGFGLRDRAEVAAPPSSPSPIASVAQTTPSRPTATPTPAATVTPSPTPAAAPGAITGRFAYGSDFVPPVTVYAISTTDPRVWYSVSFIGFGRGRTATPVPGMTEPGHYLISGLAPGTYWVVAYRTDGELPDPGFHSNEALCRRTPPGGPCPNIDPVPVTVAAGQTATGIDIVTWGVQPQPSPTLPPQPTPRP